MPDQPFRPTFARAWRLLRAFRVEQTDPDHFYGTLAADSVAQVSAYHPLDGQTVLDVGGGPGYFAEAFRRAGSAYRALDADAAELTLRGEPDPGTVVGDGMALPFRDGSFDVAYSSNVLEHVPRPWDMADELVRVTRSGGIAFISYTLWWGPWGGHETSPWHYLGGHRAARRYQRSCGRPPKNIYGTSLFRATAAAGLRWARATGARPDVEIVAVVPRYLPRWAWWAVRLPVVREVLVWNLLIVVRKR